MDDVIENRTEQADLTLLIAEKASALAYDDLPTAVRELARQCVLDYLGVTLAGAADSLVRILLDEMAEAGGSPQATEPGPGRRPAGPAAGTPEAIDYEGGGAGGRGGAW